jgi:hypothetical protein
LSMSFPMMFWSHGVPIPPAETWHGEKLCTGPRAWKRCHDIWILSCRVGMKHTKFQLKHCFTMFYTDITNKKIVKHEDSSRKE